jgi:predicted transcriptional regulator
MGEDHLIDIFSPYSSLIEYRRKRLEKICDWRYEIVLPITTLQECSMTSRAVKLDEEIYNRLKVLGEARRRSPHWLMKEAIQQFIEREEEAEHIRQDTLERWARFEATGETVSHEAVDTWLETWGTEREDKCPVT